MDTGNLTAQMHFIDTFFLAYEQQRKPAMNALSALRYVIRTCSTTIDRESKLKRPFEDILPLVKVLSSLHSSIERAFPKLMRIRMTHDSFSCGCFSSAAGDLRKLCSCTCFLTTDTRF